MTLLGFEAEFLFTPYARFDYLSEAARLYRAFRGDSVQVKVLDTEYILPSRIDYFSSWHITADFSIRASEGLGGRPAELISIPKPVPDALDDLWATLDFIAAYGYTNETTGLHINLSGKNQPLAMIVAAKRLLNEDALRSRFGRQNLLYAGCADRGNRAEFRYMGGQYHDKRELIGQTVNDIVRAVAEEFSAA